MASQLEILSNAIRSRLKSLVETLVYPLENPMVSPESLTDTDLQPFKIRRLDFDIEETPDPDSDILFDPLPQSKLDRHRINDKKARAGNPLYLSVYPKVPEERKREWHSQFLHTEQELPRHAPGFRKTMQNCVGHDGSLQYCEIASLLTSMHARAFQRDIPEDDLHPEDCDDTDGLQKFEHNPERLQKYAFAFKEECCFPILMVSFLGTDARLLFAYMDADTLVIRQSKLYSFEQPETAPWDLFARWLVGTPVEGGV
ncbi:hypothetical protein HFD88_009172 [Aspergillus terreus]|nr:hypothetical protein HFD88_009172 [Aspergillus terreus]